QVGAALAEHARLKNLPAAHARQEVERFGKRGEILEERSEAEPVLAGKRVIRKAILLLRIQNFFVQPVPPRPHDLELEQKIKRHAFVQRLLERRVERDLKISLEKITFFT